MKTDADNPGLVIKNVLVGFCLMVVLSLFGFRFREHPKTPQQRIYQYQVEHHLQHGSRPPDDPCVGKDSPEFDKCEEDLRKAKCGFWPDSPGCPGNVGEVKGKSRPNTPITLQDSSTDTNSERDHTQ